MPISGWVWSSEFVFWGDEKSRKTWLWNEFLQHHGSKENTTTTNFRRKLNDIFFFKMFRFYFSNLGSTELQSVIEMLKSREKREENIINARYKIRVLLAANLSVCDEINLRLHSHPPLSIRIMRLVLCS